MIRNYFSIKNVFLFTFLFSFFALASALISQYYFNMQPCSWCIGQRIIYIFLLLVSFIGIFIKKKYILYINLLLSIFGISMGIYQINVKKNPFACAQTLVDNILSYFDLSQIFILEVKVLCSEENAKILGIDFVNLSIIGFLIIFLITLLNFKNKKT